MKNVNERKIILNTELVRAVSEKGQITLFIRMIDGKWAKQQPYPADLRGQIGALTLAIDALAGKIILTETVILDERDFEAPQSTTIDVPAQKVLGPPKVGFMTGIQPKA